MHQPNPRIEDKTLKVHLDGTADKHNDRDYAEYKKLKQLGVNRANRAHIFGVSFKTMKSWDIIDERENDAQS